MNEYEPRRSEYASRYDEPPSRKPLPIRRHEREAVLDRRNKTEQRREKRPVRPIEMRRTNKYVEGVIGQARAVIRGNPRYRKKRRGGT